MESEEIHRLQEQNSILRAVIAQMRKDMEGLDHLQPQPPMTSGPSDQNTGPAGVDSTGSGSGSVTTSGGKEVLYIILLNSLVDAAEL